MSSPVRFGVLFLEELLVLGVLVHHGGQRGAEALFVGAALMGVDGVGEGVHRLRVAAVPLHRDLDLVAFALAGEVDDALVDGRFRAVDVLDEVDQPAGVVERAVLDLVRARLLGGLLLGRLRGLGGVADNLFGDGRGGDPFVSERDGQPLVEEGHLLQSPRDGLEVVVGGLEDVGVRPESDGGSGLLGLLALLQGARAGLVVGLEPLVTVAGDIDFQSSRQRVHHGDAHAVQTATDGVAAVLAAELAAGVELGHHHVDGRRTAGMHFDRDAAAVVGDLDPAVLEDSHVDFRRVATHGFVDRVVDDLPDEVVQAALAGGADIHARAFADSLQSFEDGDGRGAVFLLLRSHRRTLPYSLWGWGSGGDLLPPASHAVSLPSSTVRTDSEAAFLHTYSRRLWNFSIRGASRRLRTASVAFWRLSANREIWPHPYVSRGPRPAM